MSDIEGAIKSIVIRTLQELGVPFGQSTAGGAPVTTVTPVATTPAIDPFASPAANAQQVTPEMLQQLVMPMVQNEAVKARLKAVMDSMGIASLADVTAQQLAPLYAAFCRVRDEAAGTVAPTQSNPNII